MDKYISLLTEASNKASYQPSPITTLNTVEKLKTKSRQRRNAEAMQEKQREISKSPRKLAISNARIKAGRKAYLEATKPEGLKLNKLLFQKSQMEANNASPSQLREINQSIADEIASQTRKADLLHEADMLKDEPLKYLAKLHELKQEDEAITNRKLLQNQEDIRDILSLKLRPEERLLYSNEYKALTPKEQKYVVEQLKQSTKRDIPKRLKAVESFLSMDPSQRDSVLGATVSHMTVKAKAQPAEPVIKQMKKDEIKRERFDDKREAKFVMDRLMGDDSYNVETIKSNIEKYKQEYTSRSPKKYNILFENADNDEEKKEDSKEAIQEAVNTSARNEARYEIPIIRINDTDNDLVEEVARVFEDEGAPGDIARVDAKDVLGGVRADIEAEQDRGRAQADTPETEPEMPVEPERELHFPGETRINKMSRSDLLKLAEENNIQIPDHILHDKKNLTRIRGLIKQARIDYMSYKQSKRGGMRHVKGHGFRPTPIHPDFIAGSLARHIARVRDKRFKSNIHALSVHNDTENEEYRQKLKQHLLRGGGFADWFFKGLTAPFAIASKIPLPGLQQIGQLGTKVFNTIGAPTFFK